MEGQWGGLTYPDIIVSKSFCPSQSPHRTQHRIQLSQSWNGVGYISRAEKDNVWASEGCVGPTWECEDGGMKWRGSVKQVTDTVIMG